MGHDAGLRILFAGTPDFSIPPLQRLIRDGFPPIAVLTQPDRPAGRGRNVQASPVKLLAMIVVAYGLMLPQEILNLPGYGCWNIHASLLPRWRGAAPIQRAIEAGDRESGVCIMQMDEGLDTGPVIHRVSITLNDDETGGSLHDRLASLGASALLDCVTRLAGGVLPDARPQADAGVTYARKLEKSEAEIDWSLPATTLERRIRAFNPWPVAWSTVAGERLRVWKSCLPGQSHDSLPGTVLAASKDGIDVATGEKVLRLLELQRPGKRRMSAADYLNAPNIAGSLDRFS
jgi:methionyl-tRNA formyltransferase